MTRGVNTAFEKVGLPAAPLIDDGRRDLWAGRAAAVADKYGGLPFSTELLFVAATVVAFGPTYAVMFMNYKTAKQLSAPPAQDEKKEDDTP